MRNFVLEKLRDLGIDGLIIRNYDEPHRFYHNWTHIEYMLEMAKSVNQLTDALLLAIVFHDIVYDPKATDNEEKSADLFSKLYDGKGKLDIIEAIIDTKTHIPRNELSGKLCMLDLLVLDGHIEKFIDFENKIFKEYQFVDYKLYKEKRIEILNKLGVKSEFINYVKYRKPNIAVYAGSFNPFHKGHLNILKKAEQIFDKVIIARGVNPEKKNELWEMPKVVEYRQIDNYSGLLTDYINDLGYDVTLIRGLRNATDLEYEKTQYQFLKDLKSDIKVVNLFCDKEYEHISSSAIRQLKLFGKEKNYLLI